MSTKVGLVVIVMDAVSRMRAYPQTPEAGDIMCKTYTPCVLDSGDVCFPFLDWGSSRQALENLMLGINQSVEYVKG